MQYVSGLDVGPDQGFGELRERRWSCGYRAIEELAAPRVERCEDAIEHRFREGFAAREVVVDRTGVGAGGAHDFAQ